MARISDASTPRAGLLMSLAGIAKNFLALFINRIELAALELAEVRKHFFQLIGAFLFAAIAGWFALAFWSMLLVVLLWDSLGWKILLLIAAAFTFFSGIAIIYGIKMLRLGKLSLPATLAELKNDRDILLP